MNASDFLISLVFGLSIPLALSQLFRLVATDDLYFAPSGGRFSAVSALAALLAGPGLLIDRIVDEWASNRIGPDDLVLVGVAALGWAFVYGAVVLSIVSRFATVA